MVANSAFRRKAISYTYGQFERLKPRTMGRHARPPERPDGNPMAVYISVMYSRHPRKDRACSDEKMISRDLPPGPAGMHA